MVDIRRVTDAFAVSGQIRPEEIAALAPRFTVVINNRPDGEDPGQPTNAEVERAAEAAGLAYHHIPVTGAPNAEQVRLLQARLREADGPALAFCRTGTRCIVTWALGEALDGRPVETLVDQGRAAGYDLEPPLQALLPRLREQGGA